MLSRIASRAVAQTQSLARPAVFGMRLASSEPAKEAPAAPAAASAQVVDPLENPTRIFPTVQEGPERDLVNFPRPVQKEHPDPVRLGFIPEEWFEFFYKKTGVSGPYVFGGGLITYLLSKEIYVLEHNFYNGISFWGVIIFLHYKIGPKLAAWTDKEIDAEIQNLREFEQSEKDAIKEEIMDIRDHISKLEVYKNLAEARRETVAAALEATYREWENAAYREAKRRLDYQLELVEVERRISQKNMSSWITENVLKSISATQEQDTLKKCVADLKALSATA